MKIHQHIFACIHAHNRPQMRERNVEALPLMHAVADHLQKTDQKSAGDASSEPVYCSPKRARTQNVHEHKKDHICNMHIHVTLLQNKILTSVCLLLIIEVRKSITVWIAARKRRAR